MSCEFSLTKKEKKIIRELAEKYMEYANLPIMEKRKRLWYCHNDLNTERPMIVMEMDTFENDMLLRLQCESPAAMEIERNLMKGIVNHELIDDDKVIPPYYTVYWNIDIKEFGIDIKTEYGIDGSGRAIGYHLERLHKQASRAQEGFHFAMV